MKTVTSILHYELLKAPRNICDSGPVPQHSRECLLVGTPPNREMSEFTDFCQRKGSVTIERNRQLEVYHRSEILQ